ncbi:GW dipeptide domain-containing protein [Oenococcus oeni]|uniref:GW dipeptide domain-containing protein n=2 Tax=Oenococcus oeni TaxID=1247 RepID=UPI0009B4FB63|nr:GW dipeptide domain-containing protein [Oenococcus oeni]
MHKKMYKSGKTWLIGIVLASGMLLFPLSANADISVNSQNDATKSISTDQQGTESTDTTQDSSLDSTKQVESETAKLQTETVVSSMAELKSSAASSASSDVTAASSIASPTSSDVTAASSASSFANSAAAKSAEISSAAAASSAALIESQEAARASYFASLYPQLNSQAVSYAGLLSSDVSSLTDSQITALNSDYWSGSSQASTLNASDMSTLDQDWQNSSYAYPEIDSSKVENLSAADMVDSTPNVTTGEVDTQAVQLDVWDSWPLQNAQTGAVQLITINGKKYQIVIAMAGRPDTWSDGHLYIFYKNDDGSAALDQWKNGGAIFPSVPTDVDYTYGVDQDTASAWVGANPLVQDSNLSFHENQPVEAEQWSGSAVLNSDNTIQLYYTSVEIADNYAYLATATLSLASDSAGGIYVSGIKNDHIIFSGDGHYYLTNKQIFDYESQEEKSGQPQVLNGMRDPHVILVNGQRYLAFESTTLVDNGQGIVEDTNDLSDYANDLSDAVNTQNTILLSSSNTNAAKISNAVIGLLKLDENNNVAEVLPPIVTATMASTEIERPSIVPMNGKFYLFVATRVSRSSIDNTANNGDVMMLGYVADSIDGPFKPLNNNGLVVAGTDPQNSRTFTYSYFAIPVPNTNRIIITSYMSNRNFASGQDMYSTFAPSFEISVNGDQTSIIPNSVLAQGTITESDEAFSIGQDLSNINYFGADILSSENENYDGVIVQTKRNDGVFFDGPAFTSKDTLKANDNGTNYNGDFVTVVESVTTKRYNGLLYTFLKVNDESKNITYWIDQRAIEPIYYDSITSTELKNQWAVIDENKRNDGIYYSGPALTNYLSMTANASGKTVNGDTIYVTEIDTTLRKSNGEKYQYAKVEDGNKSYWVDLRALDFSKYAEITSSSDQNFSAYINESNRDDGIYTDGPALTSPTAMKSNGSAKSVNGDPVSVVAFSKTIRANGKTYSYFKVNDGQKTYWIDSRAVYRYDQIENTVTPKDEYATIDQSVRNDGIYKNGPALTSSNTIQKDGLAKSYNGDTVLVLQASTTIRQSNGMTYTYLQVQDGQDTYWIDSRGLHISNFATISKSSVNSYTAYINQKQRNDGVYYSGPALTSSDTLIANSNGRSYNGDRVTVLQTKTTKRSNGVYYTYAQVLDGNKTYWIDQRALSTKKK